MKVLVVGGGAAGLMAAGAALRQGHEVTVLEHMEKPAQKILVTGKGRCNVTNDCTAEEFLHHVRTNPRFLFSSLGAFPPAKTMELFESLGVELKVERGRRVFPVSDKAEEIRQALLRYADGADIVHDGAKKLLLEPLAQPEEAPAAPEDPRHPKKKKPGPAYRCVGVRGTSGREYKADAVLVATGGLSYPTTGSTGDGYKGIVHQPDPEKKEDFLHGLIAMRHMHIRALSETGLSAADEMLYPENWGYVSDILSYVAIGARSVEDQQHRLTVSGFDLPSGMKNPTSGDFSVMLNSVYAAQHPHRFIYRGYEVQTNGNDLAHTVLRGATSKHGRNIPNYHYEDLQILLGLYNERDLKNPACIIDSNHSNSNKQFDQQVRIVKEVMHSRHLSPDIHNFVKGVMIESYIEEGNQKVGGGVYGKSITDACLGWEASERLIYDLAELNY